MISIVIPTLKQRYLESTLSSIRSQKTNIDFEIILVENGEQNGLTKELSQIYNCRYFFLDQEGANNARNFGIESSKFDYIGLIDDDIVLSKNWMSEFSDSIKKSDFSLLSGPVSLKFTEEPKPWIQNQFRLMLAEVDIENQLPIQTSSSFFIKPNSGYHVVSANMIIDKSNYDRKEIFDTEFGYKGKDFLAANDETLLLDEAFESKGILYNPNLSVVHIIDSDKNKLNFFKKRFYGQGYSDLFIHMKRMNCDVHDSWVHLIKNNFNIVDLEADIDDSYFKAYSICKIEYFKGVLDALCSYLQSENRELPLDELFE